MISITNKDSNYLARIMRIDNLVEIPGARTLQKTIVDYQEVAVSKDTEIGDIVVYFPAGAKIDHEYLSATNSFAKKELNADTDVSGYFNSKGLVKATKFMKGQINSTGYIVPAYSYFKEGYSVVPTFLDQEPKDFVPIDFDTINGKVVVEKYVAPIRGGNLGGPKGRQAKKLSRLVDNQVYLHQSTDNLRRHIDKIDVNAPVSISYKIHGTSGWLAHVQVKKQLGLWQKFLKFLGADIETVEYDCVYGSRKVVKNKHFREETTINSRYWVALRMGDKKGKVRQFKPELTEEDYRVIFPLDETDTKIFTLDYMERHLPGFTRWVTTQTTDYFGYDLWADVVEKNDLRSKVPKNYTIYYEIAGFTKDGAYIQSGYDYGEKKGHSKVYVYRVTNVNADGIVYNLSTADAMKFCERVGLEHAPVFHTNTKLSNWQSNKLQNNAVDHRNIIDELENQYNGKNCYMCTESVPEEGIVVRVETNPFEWKAFKLKDFRFLGREGDQLEKGESNIEDAN